MGLHTWGFGRIAGLAETPFGWGRASGHVGSIRAVVPETEAPLSGELAGLLGGPAYLLDRFP